MFKGNLFIACSLTTTTTTPTTTTQEITSTVSFTVTESEGLKYYYSFSKFFIWVFKGTCHHGDLYANENDCSRFSQCVHGKIINKRCTTGMMYSKTKFICDLPANVQCWSTGIIMVT